MTIAWLTHSYLRLNAVRLLNGEQPHAVSAYLMFVTDNASVHDLHDLCERIDSVCQSMIAGGLVITRRNRFGSQCYAHSVYSATMGGN